jgi:hypothetical protein
MISVNVKWESQCKFSFLLNALSFRLLFAIMIPVMSSFHGRIAHLHDFVITCKRCKENIVASVQTMPDACLESRRKVCFRKSGGRGIRLMMRMF